MWRSETKLLLFVALQTTLLFMNVVKYSETSVRSCHKVLTFEPPSFQKDRPVLMLVLVSNLCWNHFVRGNLIKRKQQRRQKCFTAEPASAFKSCATYLLVWGGKKYHMATVKPVSCLKGKGNICVNSFTSLPWTEGLEIWLEVVWLTFTVAVDWNRYLPNADLDMQRSLWFSLILDGSDGGQLGTPWPCCCILMALVILQCVASSSLPGCLKIYHKTSLDFEPVCLHWWSTPLVPDLRSMTLKDIN